MAGLSYSCYEGSWIRLPNFHALKPVKTGVVANFDTGLATRPENVGLAFRGWLEVPQDGEYTLTLISDDGSRLFVGDIGPGDGQGAVIKTTGLTGALPIPRRSFPGAVLPANDPVQWSTVEGVATFVCLSTGTPQLELADGSAKMQVDIVGGLRESLLLLPQSRIRVTGLTEPCLTPEGRLVAARLLVPNLQSVDLLEAAPRHWNQHPLQTISNLLSHPPRPESVGHLRGRARLMSNGGGFWLRDGAGEVFVQTAQSLPPANDVRLEVLGLWRGGSETNRLVLDQAVYRQWAQFENAPTNHTTITLPLLTKIEEIHALSRVEAEKKYPFRVRGVITDSWEESGLVQDDTRGIFFSGGDHSQFAVGDLVEIQGFSAPGDFAPNLAAQRITRLGLGIMPEPARPTWDLLLNGAMDCQWVELKGIVTQIQTNHIILRMVGGEMRLYQYLSQDDWKPFLNALVCLRGCLTARWSEHQVIAGEVTIARLQIDCLEPAPADPFDAPAKTIPEMWLFSLQSSALRRIKVTGQVLSQRGRECFLQEETNGLRFVLREPASFEPGARVEVVGFPELDGPSPVLRIAVRSSNARNNCAAKSKSTNAPKPNSRTRPCCLRTRWRNANGSKWRKNVFTKNSCRSPAALAWPRWRPTSCTTSATSSTASTSRRAPWPRVSRDRRSPAWSS